MQFVRDSLIAAAGQDKLSQHELSDNPTILLLKAWRNFLLVVSRSKVWRCVTFLHACACEGRREGEMCWGVGGGGGEIYYGGVLYC